MKRFFATLTLLSVLFFFSPFPANAAGTIAFDNSCGGGSTQTGGFPASITFNCTVNSNTNGILWITAKGDAGNQATMSQPTVTYNGVSMTFSQTKVGNSTQGTLFTFYLVAPSTGTHSVVVTQGATAVQFLSSSGASYTGVNQSTPVDVSAVNAATVTGTFTTSAVTTVDNDWGIYFVSGNGTVVSSTNTTTRVSGAAQPANYIGDTNGAQTPVGSKSMSVTTAVDGNEIAILSFMEPAVAATTFHVTWDF